MALFWGVVRLTGVEPAHRYLAPGPKPGVSTIPPQTLIHHSLSPRLASGLLLYGATYTGTPEFVIRADMPDSAFADLLENRRIIIIRLKPYLQISGNNGLRAAYRDWGFFSSRCAPCEPNGSLVTRSALGGIRTHTSFRTLTPQASTSTIPSRTLNLGSFTSHYPGCTVLRTILPARFAAGLYPFFMRPRDS